MNYRFGCAARAPELDVPCDLRRGHDGEHQHTTLQGEVIYAWPPDSLDPIGEDGPTLDEFLEHLDDLVALARVEGFGLFAALLAKQQALIAAQATAFTPTNQERDAARRELADLETRRTSN